jgi:hypothetical protein
MKAATSFILALFFALVSEGQVVGSTTCKFSHVSATVKKGKNKEWPCVQFDYSLSVNSSLPRTKTPVIVCLVIIEDKNTTRRYPYGQSDISYIKGKSETTKEIALSEIRSTRASIQDALPLYTGSKVLLSRLEVWHDGVMQDSWQSITEDQRSRLNIPDDWRENPNR